MCLTSLPVKIKGREKSGERLASKEILHRLGNFAKDLLAGATQSFLALSDKRVIEYVDNLGAFSLQVLLKQYLCQLRPILIHLHLVFFDCVQKKIVTVIGWLFVLAILPKEQSADGLLVNHIAVSDIYKHIRKL
jgi:hypothetical protein